MADETLLTVDEVASVLRASPESVRRWCRDGVLRSVKLGRRHLIPRSEIERILSEPAEPVVLAGGRSLDPAKIREVTHETGS